jgi:glutamate carboxypeptidase
MLQTRDIAKSIPGTQLNWTTAQSGTVRNQIPEKAVASADIRVTAPDGLQKLQAALDEKVKEKLIPDTETAVKIEPGRPPFVAGDRGLALARRGQEIYAEIGRTLDIAETSGGGTDAGPMPTAAARRSWSKALALPATAITPATNTSTRARSCRGSI